MDLATIAALAAVLTPIALLALHLLGILEKLWGFVTWAWKVVSGRSTAAHPRQTLILIRRPQENALWWHMGNTGQGGPHRPPLPVMQVCADLNVTNTWHANVTMASAVLRYRPWWSVRSQRELGHALLFHGGGSQTIPPNSMHWVRADFIFKPPWRAVGEELVADFGILDQFNNCHWLRGVRFPYR